MFVSECKQGEFLGSSKSQYIKLLDDIDPFK